MTGHGSGLYTVPFGLAFGVTWGLSMFVLGLASYFFGVGGEWVTSFGHIYKGFDATVAGSMVGFFWGFVDGFVGGFILAYFYNMFSSCCEKYCGKSK